MNTTLFATPAAEPLASFRRFASAPVPWHAAHAARRAATALQPGVAARSPRVAAALARRVAHNPVAVDRLFAALAAAVGPEIATRRHAARRHHALTADALTPALPQAHEAGEPPGIAQDVLFCIAGKRLDLRGITRPLEVTHHAAARFAKRSGRYDAESLHAAIAEAASHAPAVLVAHLDGGLSWRLRGGTAPILLPAGEGAFLGRLRLLPLGREGRALPVMEAATWLHAASLDTAQLQARDVLLAGLPPETLLAALAEAWAGLCGNVSGDRRVLAGLATLPYPAGADRRTRLALACCAPMAAARLALGLACADTLAAEWAGTH